MHINITILLLVYVNATETNIDTTTGVNQLFILFYLLFFTDLVGTGKQFVIRELQCMICLRILTNLETNSMLHGPNLYVVYVGTYKVYLMKFYRTLILYSV